MKHADPIPFPLKRPRALPAPRRRDTGRIILPAPETEPQPLKTKSAFAIKTRTFRFDMVQVDLIALIPAAASRFVENPTDAGSVVFWPIVRVCDYLAGDRSPFNQEAHQRLSLDVGIDYAWHRRMRQVTLLLNPCKWEDAQHLAAHFSTTPLAVLRAALRIGLDEKLANDRHLHRTGRELCNQLPP